MADFGTSGGTAGGGSWLQQPAYFDAEREAATAQPFDFLAIAEELKALLSKQIFFVGGLARSGTTWLQLLLDFHPQVSCGNEGHFVNNLFPRLRTALEDHNALLLKKAQREFGEFGESFPIFDLRDLRYLFACGALLLLNKRARGRQVRAVGEKTPENVQTFAGLTRVFQNAKCIHIVRDPRDAAVSGWFHVLRVIPDETRAHFSSMPDYLRYYIDLWTNENVIGADFGDRNPACYRRVRYEDLLVTPEPTLKALYGFLGVDDSDAVVRACLEKTSFERMSGGRARGTEDRSSFFRKGVSGEWKSHFDPESLRYALEKAGPLMRRMGYL